MTATFSIRPYDCPLPATSSLLKAGYAERTDQAQKLLEKITFEKEKLNKPLHHGYLEFFNHLKSNQHIRHISLGEGKTHWL